MIHVLRHDSRPCQERAVKGCSRRVSWRVARFVKRRHVAATCGALHGERNRHPNVSRSTACVPAPKWYKKVTRAGSNWVKLDVPDLLCHLQSPDALSHKMSASCPAANGLTDAEQKAAKVFVDGLSLEPAQTQQEFTRHAYDAIDSSQEFLNGSDSRKALKSLLIHLIREKVQARVDHLEQTGADPREVAAAKDEVNTTPYLLQQCLDRQWHDTFPSTDPSMTQSAASTGAASSGSGV